MRKRSILFALLSAFVMVVCSCNSTAEAHKHVFDESVWEYDGFYHWHPSICGHDIEGNEEEHKFKDVVTQPTFESGGYTTHICVVCGYSFRDSETGYLKHSYSEDWEYNEMSHWHPCIDEGYENKKKGEALHSFESVVTPPTFETNGYTTHKCTVCGYTYVDSETDHLEHNYSTDWTNNETKHWHDCIDDGYEYLKTEESYHTFNDIVTPPSFEDNGYTTHICTVCGYTYVDSETDHLEHNYSTDWTNNETKHWHDCIDDGYEYLTKDEECHNFEEQVVSPSHSAGGYTIHTCTVCGYTYRDSETGKLPYTITWVNWDGLVLQSEEYFEGQIPSYNGVPTKNSDDDFSYTFVGWYPSIKPVDSDVVYVAQFDASTRQYVIHYDADGGIDAPEDQLKTKKESLILSEDVPEREHYVFCGWNCLYSSKTYQPGDVFDIDGDITLYAMWCEQCHECDGIGHFTHESTCNSCGGKGTITTTNPKRWVSCSRCSGSGKITTTSTQICSKCNGYGGDVLCECSCGYRWWANQAKTRKCANCGKIVNGQKKTTCPNCSGTGTIKTQSYSLCTVCSGQGGYYVEDSSTQRCSSCNGTGKITRTTTCSTCCGDGLLIPSSPVLQSMTYNSVILQGKAGYEYKVDNCEWQSSPIFENLSCNTTYSFYERVASTNSKTFGITSRVLTITTPQIPTYSITYNLNGGTNNSSNPSSYTIESSVIFENPTKVGYTFIGWFDNSNNQITSISVGTTGDIVLNAKWNEGNSYEISLNPNGGVVSETTVNVQYDCSYCLPIPEREGYTFIGWYNGSTKVLNDGVWSHDNIDNLNAKWSVIRYSITYNLNGGTNNSSNPSSYTIESEDIAISTPTKNGYLFNGWTGSNGDEPSTNVIIKSGSTGNKEYVANWTLGVYSITYVLYGGTNHSKNPSSYTTEDTITLKNPSKEYYTFDGWYTDPEFVNQVTSINGLYGDLVLYAKFIPYTFESHFDANGGYLSSEKINVTINWNNGRPATTVAVPRGKTIDLYKVGGPENYYYSEYSYNRSFGGFYYDSAFKTPVKKTGSFDSDITLYVKWNSDYPDIHPNGLYGISYSLSSNSSTTTTGEVTKVLRAPLYSNGWLDIYFFANDSSSTTMRVTNSKGTVIFQKTGAKYGVEQRIYFEPGELLTFYKKGYCGGYPRDMNYGGLEFSTSANDYLVTQTYDSKTSAPACAYDGYDFLGWYDENDNLITDNWNYSSAQSFHAKWDIHKYNINYVLNGGTNNENNPSSYTMNDTVTLFDPTREGYTFAGWYLESNYVSKITIINGSSNKDYTLYAKWTPNNYTATLDYDGGQNCPTVNFYSQGNLIKSVNLYKDSTLDYFVPESPRDNLKFGGWYTDSSYNNLYSFNGLVNSNLNLYAKWIDVSNYQYSPLGNNVNVQINGNEFQYIAIVSQIKQTITITSSSGLDLYGEVYDSNWNVVSSCDDISDENLDFSITVTLLPGSIYYIAYKANQAMINGECNISISGNSTINSHVTGDYTEIIDSFIVTYGSSEFYLPTPKKEGYVFAGWFDENGNKIDDTLPWSYSDNITIYAHWIAVN